MTREREERVWMRAGQGAVAPWVADAAAFSGVCADRLAGAFA